MDKKKLLLAAQSLLCAALTVWLAAAALGVCRSGLARKAANPSEPIYSPEIVARYAGPAAPLLVLAVGVTVAAAAAHARDEAVPKPAKLERTEHRPFSGERPLRAVLLIAALCLIVLGAFNGSARDVFGKAVRICTECIGLG